MIKGRMDLCSKAAAAAGHIQNKKQITERGWITVINLQILWNCGSFFISSSTANFKLRNQCERFIKECESLV